MVKKISKNTRIEILKALKNRYTKVSRKEKTKILDEFISLSGYHRKHAVRLLRNNYQSLKPDTQIVSRRIYDEAVKKALIIVWEAADRICSKRLKASLLDFIDTMEMHGHLKLDSEVRKRLLKISASTIDRLLSDVREQAHTHKKRKKTKKKLRKQVPIRTFADWNKPKPGYLEIDFVVHSGGLMSGNFIHTLVATDVCSGWTEYVPLLAREQSLVIEGMNVIRNQFPFPVLGIDSDNDSAFINDTLINYCEKNNIEFTRSRPYHKNDQAWIEQKNGAIVRRFVGYERFSGVIAGQALANMYQAIRLYVNYFQPSFKLRKKERQGAKIKKIYYPPKTPYSRLMNNEVVDKSVKENLQTQRIKLDPVKLLHQIRDNQSDLVALSSPENNTTGPGRTSLKQFLSQLPILWQSGDARPTHQKKSNKPRYWRTREDPFKEVWPDVLQWLQKKPETTAKELFIRLQQDYPGIFIDCQLRTLQRRIKEWRKIMAKELVYSCMSTTNEHDKIAPVGIIN